MSAALYSEPAARDTPEPGPVELLEREQEVLGLLAAGRTVREICSALGLSRSTVRDRVEDLGRLFGVKGAAAVVAAAVRTRTLRVPARMPVPVDPWERLVIRLVGAGLTDKEIAKTLGKSRDTVHKRIQSLRDRLGAVNRAQLVYRAAAVGAYPEQPVGGKR